MRRDDLERELPEVVRVDPVTTHPDLMHGTPCFRGSRVPVRFLFEWLAGDETLEYFLDQFPSVHREDALAVLKQASDRAEHAAVLVEPRRLTEAEIGL